MEEIRDKSNQIEALLDKNSAALVVVDKQKGYIEPHQPLIRQLGTTTMSLQEVIPKLDDFIERARKSSIPIIWTQMAEDLEHSSPSIIRKMRIEESPSLLTPGEESYDFYGTVHPLDDEKVLHKTSYDAFSTTSLDAYLKENDISTIVLTGAYTSRCVLSTAFVANGLGYNVFAVEDLLGVPEKFAVEAPVALRIIDAILGFVVSSDFLADVWNFQMAV